MHLYPPIDHSKSQSITSIFFPLVIASSILTHHTSLIIIRHQADSKIVDHSLLYYYFDARDNEAVPENDIADIFRFTIDAPGRSAVGFGMKKIAKDAEPDASAVDKGDIDLDDPELLEAISMMGDMTADEMEKLMEEVAAMLGDDPDAVAAVNKMMQELPNMQIKGLESAVKDVISEADVEAATNDALKLLGKSKWETIWEKQDLILDAVIESGNINAEDAAKYKSDPVEWEKELRLIWAELQELSRIAEVGSASGEEL